MIRGAKSGSRGTRADQGVRPTNSAAWAYLSGSDHFGAPIEEQLPLRALDLERLAFLGRPGTLSGGFAVVDERQRVPTLTALDAD